MRNLLSLYFNVFFPYPIIGDYFKGGRESEGVKGVRDGYYEVEGGFGMEERRGMGG